jgi:coronin-2
VAYLGQTGRLATTGFSRYSDRQLAIWQDSDLSTPLRIDDIDSSSGIIFPIYDADTRILYLAGKGDGNIRYYEMVETSPYWFYLNQYLSGNPQRGLGVMPKRGVDPSCCEIMRFFKLNASKGSCEPISMTVPRKSDPGIFHEDLYPETPGPTATLTAAEWLSGKSSAPLMISLKSG